MKHEQVAVTEIKLNPNNPRSINRTMFEKLKDSIREFPEMLEKRPLVVDENMILLGGNMRFRALQELGYELIPIDRADNWTDEQKRQFIIKDNVSFGTWDNDDLGNNWDIAELDSWGVPLPFDKDDIEEMQNPDNVNTDHPFATELDQQSNYVVLKFQTDIDWLQAKTLLGIKTEVARNEKGKKQATGTGKVLDGPHTIDLIKRASNEG
jgi:hypothetical protein